MLFRSLFLAYVQFETASASKAAAGLLGDALHAAAGNLAGGLPTIVDKLLTSIALMSVFLGTDWNLVWKPLQPRNWVLGHRVIRGVIKHIGVVTIQLG